MYSTNHSSYLTALQELECGGGNMREGQAGRKYLVVFVFQGLSLSMALLHPNPVYPWEVSGELNQTRVAAQES